MNEQVAMLLVDQVLTEVTAANGGDLIVLNASVRNLGPIKIGVPLAEATKLFTVLLAGASQAHSQMVIRAGGEQNLVNAQALAFLRPTDYELGYATSPEEQLVLLRLKQNRVPIVDVLFTRDGAHQVAKDMTEHAKAVAPQSPPKQ